MFVTLVRAENYRHILPRLDGRVAVVSMNRPERRNALSEEHMRELTDFLKAVGGSREVSVVILKGEGPAFCAGHDLSEMVDRDISFYRHLFDVCTELMETIQAIPQPVIAQVHGMATAAGCQLVATCDLAVASEEARFATPGVKIGLFCSTPMVALSRAVGRKKAMEMLLTGEPIIRPGSVGGRPGEPGGSRRAVGGGDPRPGRKNRGGQRLYGGDRKAGLLPAAGDAATPGLRLRQGSDVPQRDGRRRPGGDVRLPGEAVAPVAPSVMRDAR